MIDWILDSFSDIETREAALEFANTLLDQGFFVHMNKRLKFMDGHYFYCLRESSSEIEDRSKRELAQSASQSSGALSAKSSVQWFLSKIGRPSLVHTESDLTSLSLLKDASAKNPLKRDIMALSKSVTIDVDLQRRNGKTLLGNDIIGRLKATKYGNAPL